MRVLSSRHVKAWLNVSMPSMRCPVGAGPDAPVSPKSGPKVPLRPDSWLKVLVSNQGASTGHSNIVFHVLTVCAPAASSSSSPGWPGLLTRMFMIWMGQGQHGYVGEISCAIQQNNASGPSEATRQTA